MGTAEKIRCCVMFCYVLGNRNSAGYADLHGSSSSLNKMYGISSDPTGGNHDNRPVSTTSSTGGYQAMSPAGNPQGYPQGYPQARVNTGGIPQARISTGNHGYYNNNAMSGIYAINDVQV